MCDRIKSDNNSVSYIKIKENTMNIRLKLMVTGLLSGSMFIQAAESYNQELGAGFIRDKKRFAALYENDDQIDLDQKSLELEEWAEQWGAEQNRDKAGAMQRISDYRRKIGGIILAMKNGDDLEDSRYTLTITERVSTFPCIGKRLTQSLLNDLRRLLYAAHKYNRTEDLLDLLGEYLNSEDAVFKVCQYCQTFAGRNQDDLDRHLEDVHNVDVE